MAIPLPLIHSRVHQKDRALGLAARCTVCPHLRALAHRKSPIRRSMAERAMVAVTAAVRPADDVAVRSERISLTCPYTQLRIVQAARTTSCVHASAFCSLMQPVRCPVCGAEAPLVVDGRLTVFLSTHTEAIACEVRRAADGGWTYSKPQHAPTRKKRRLSSSAPTTSKHHRQQAEPTAAPAVSTRIPADARRREREARTRKAALTRSLEQTRLAMIQRALREDASTAAEALWATDDHHSCRTEPEHVPRQHVIARGRVWRGTRANQRASGGGVAAVAGPRGYY